MPPPEFKVDAVLAVADLVARTGATQFEIGYQHDETDPEYEQVGSQWYASAYYRGARVTMDEQPTPEHAADGLAHRLLDGGTCQHCREKTTTKDTPTGVYLRFGRSKKARCVWWRDGTTWKRGCE